MSERSFLRVESMSHWHRCRRFYEKGLPCPFGSLEEEQRRRRRRRFGEPDDVVVAERKRREHPWADEAAAEVSKIVERQIDQILKDLGVPPGEPQPHFPPPVPGRVPGPTPEEEPVPVPAGGELWLPDLRWAFERALRSMSRAKQRQSATPTPLEALLTQIEARLVGKQSHMMSLLEPAWPNSLPSAAMGEGEQILADALQQVIQPSKPSSGREAFKGRHIYKPLAAIGAAAAGAGAGGFLFNWSRQLQGKLTGGWQVR